MKLPLRYNKIISVQQIVTYITLHTNTDFMDGEKINFLKEINEMINMLISILIYTKL